MSDLPWQLRERGSLKAVGHFATRQAAMNEVDRPWRKGWWIVSHIRTGEEWHRRGGAWDKHAAPLKDRAS